METKPLRLFSYTRSASDQHCERARYYAREWGGTGLQSVGPAGWALVYGNIGHQALEELAKTGTCDFIQWRKKIEEEAPNSGYDQVAARDWGALMEGQLRGFCKAIWPFLLAEYDIVEAEKWIELEVEPGLIFRARQDLLLKNKFDGHYCYVDYKFVGNTDPKWIKSWNKSIQLHSSMYALNQSTGCPVDRAIVIGLNKGYEDRKTKLRRSPFTYGYANREFSMTPAYSVEYQRSRGWELFSTAAEFSDLSEWVDQIPQPILSEQLAQTAPIFLREDMAQEWLRQQAMREGEVGDACIRLAESTSIEEINTILAKHFRQNFDKCEPAYGFECEFRNICWIPSVGADPLGSGQFTRYESDLGEKE